jgi:hypothetical protein
MKALLFHRDEALIGRAGEARAGHDARTHLMHDLEHLLSAETWPPSSP